MINNHLNINLLNVYHLDQHAKKWWFSLKNIPSNNGTYIQIAMVAQSSECGYHLHYQGMMENLI
jgi:hypothetical protein